MPFDGGMVSVVAPRYVELRQRLVEQKRDHVLDRVDELVQSRDLACSAIVAVRPGKDVGKRDWEAESASACDDREGVPRYCKRGCVPCAGRAHPRRVEAKLYRVVLVERGVA